MVCIKYMITLCVFCVFSMATIAVADNAEQIGEIKTMTPEAKIIRGDSVVVAKTGMGILINDKILTESDGTLGIVFKDGAVLTLGPDSEFTVTEYVFKPSVNETSFISKMKKGAASYISGAIGRINPKSVQIETPTAYLGLRGTKILINVE